MAAKSESKEARDAEIVWRHLGGRSLPSLADEYKLSVRQLEKIYAAYRNDRTTLTRRDPQEIVDYFLLSMETDLDRLGKIAEEAKNDNARIGAINAKRAIMREQLELLQAIGSLPEDLTMLSTYVDGRITAQRIMEVVIRHGLAEEIVVDMARALGTEVPEPGEIPVLTGTVEP